MGTDLSTSIIDKALSINVPGVYMYRLSGAGYSGNDLPNISYAYGYAGVFWRNKSAITIVLYGAASNTPLANNSYNGDKWTGWNTYVTNSDLAGMKFFSFKNGLLLGENVSNGSTWLIVAQRLSVNDCILMIGNFYNNAWHLHEIYKSSSFAYDTNSQGTIQLKYLDTATNIYGCAIRIA